MHFDLNKKTVIDVVSFLNSEYKLDSKKWAMRGSTLERNKKYRFI